MRTLHDADGAPLEARGATVTHHLPACVKIDAAGIGWESGEDPDLPDGTPGSGVDRFDYRYRVNGGSWIAAASQFPGFDLAGVAAGDVVDVEVTTLDVVGNASTASGSVTITADVDGDFVVADADLAPPGLPTLSAAQIQRALSLLASDARVNAIAGNGYTVADVDAWGQGTGQLIGATVTVALGGERTLEADWPTVAYDATLDPPYEESVFHFRVASATELEVLVDLNRGRVVGIAPLDGEESAGAFLAWRGTAGGQRVYSLRAMRRMQADEPPPENPEGRPTRTLHVKCFREDCFMNYDFGAKARTLGPSSKRVDWPVGTIYRAAEVDKVKRRAGFPYDGSAQWAFMNDGKGWVWDSNEGAKENKCSFFFKTAHTRVYADADDQLFNLRFGYYVLATQHFDAKECLKWGRWYGKSETAEHSIIHRLEEAKKNNNWDGFFDGWAFSEDQLPLNNREYGKIEDKRLENDGKASLGSVICARAGSSPSSPQSARSQARPPRHSAPGRPAPSSSPVTGLGRSRGSATETSASPDRAVAPSARAGASRSGSRAARTRAAAPGTSVASS